VRARQVWTIARIELRRAFFAKRGLWVYALALLPALAFFGHGIDAKMDLARLGRGGLTDAALMNGVQKGETLDAVKARLGKPAEDNAGTRVRRVRKKGGDNGTTVCVDGTCSDSHQHPGASFLQPKAIPHFEQFFSVEQ